MNHNFYKGNNIQFYYCQKLKWWQKILQKLHIKNYYKPITSAVNIDDILESDK